MPGWLGSGGGGRFRHGPSRTGELTREIGLAALQQPQPYLAQVGKANGLPQQLDWHLADDRDRRRVQPLGDLGAGAGGTDDHAPLFVNDDPRGARRACPVDCRAGRGRVRHVVGAGVQARVEGGLQGEPDGGVLRGSEDHPGRGGVIAADRARVPVEDLRQHVGLVLAHVGQQRAPVDITDRVQPRQAGNGE
jgi:hypothetical protein